MILGDTRGAQACGKFWFIQSDDPSSQAENLPLRDGCRWIQTDATDPRLKLAEWVWNASAVAWDPMPIGTRASGADAATLQGHPASDFAPIASPALTGTPTAPTQAAGNNSTRLATTAFVAAALAALVNSSPTTLDTLKELADALGDDPNYAATIATALGLKAPLASPALTGSPTAPTPVGSDDSTKIATTAFVKAVASAIVAGVASFNGRTGAVSPASGDYAVGDVTGAAPLASPTFTGTPAAPTAGAGTNTTQLATTAFVQSAIAALVASSPSALDTLNELAAALGNDANFATTIATALGTKAPLASPALTGTPTVPTAAAGTNTTQAASTAFVTAAVAAGGGGGGGGLTASLCRAKRTTAQAIINATETAVLFDAEDYDTDSYHSTASNTSRFTAPVTGQYRVSAGVAWASNGSGKRILILKKNGVSGAPWLHANYMYAQDGGFITTNEITLDLPLAAGDYVELIAYQSSGGGLNIDVANIAPWFAIQRIG